MPDKTQIILYTADKQLAVLSNYSRSNLLKAQIGQSDIYCQMNSFCWDRDSRQELVTFSYIIRHVSIQPSGHDSQEI